MEAFLFSANAVLPVFAVMLLGYLLRRFGVIDEAFTATATRLMFRAALPCMLFLDVMEGDITHTFDAALLLAALGGALAAVALLRLTVPRFIPDPACYAAFIQGAFRGNVAIIGVAVMHNLAGEIGVAKIAMVISLSVPVYNIVSVLLLAEAGAAHDKRALWHSIYTNPLVIACLLGLAASALGVSLPPLLRSPLQMLSDMALPLSLVALGGTIELHHGDANIRRAAAAALIKTALMPLVMLPLCYLLGMRGVDLAAMLIFFGTPTAVSSFPMAREMGADYHLASMIIVFSNILSLFTIFAALYILRMLGLV